MPNLRISIRRVPRMQGIDMVSVTEAYSLCSLQVTLLVHRRVPLSFGPGPVWASNPTELTLLVHRRVSLSFGPGPVRASNPTEELLTRYRSYSSVRSAQYSCITLNYHYYLLLTTWNGTANLCYNQNVLHKKTRILISFMCLLSQLLSSKNDFLDDLGWVNILNECC